MSAAAPNTVVVQNRMSDSRFALFVNSSVGRKAIMAVTGAILSVFVLGHMVGNLNAFLGGDALDAYGRALRRFPPLLWAVRLGLLVSVLLHIWAYWVLSWRSWAARPQGYRVTSWTESTWASRTMRWTGPLLAAFVVFHILHLTTGHLHPDFRDGEVYYNLIAGLQVVPVAVFYLVALAALGFHTIHGVWSTFQTVGISQPRYGSFARKLATLFTILVIGGFAAIPVAILAGFLR